MIEAMKMENVLRAAQDDATVRERCSRRPGDSLAVDQPILELQ